MPGLRNSSGTIEAGEGIQPTRIFTGCCCAEACCGNGSATAIASSDRRKARMDVLPVSYRCGKTITTLPRVLLVCDPYSGLLDHLEIPLGVDPDALDERALAQRIGLGADRIEPGPHALIGE